MYYLIAVTVASSIDREKKERLVWAVPEEARLCDVVSRATDRCEIPGALVCTGLDIIGTGPKFEASMLLFSPSDVTDMEEGENGTR